MKIWNLCVRVIGVIILGDPIHSITFVVELHDEACT